MAKITRQRMDGKERQRLLDAAKRKEIQIITKGGTQISAERFDPTKPKSSDDQYSTYNLVSDQPSE